MKSLLIIIFTFFLSIQAYCQNNIGLDDNPILNNTEAVLLDLLFLKKRGAFHFTNKKVGFFSGHSVTDMETKSEFFQKYVIPFTSKSKRPPISYIELDEAQRIKSGGYDAKVFMIPKILTQKQVAKNIQKLSQIEGEK